MREGGDIPVASPILAADLVILTSGHGKYRPMRAVRLEAQGDITSPEMGATNQFVAWCHPRKGNYLQTPIAVDMRKLSSQEAKALEPLMRWNR